MRDLAQEAREMGLATFLYRVGWEVANKQELAAKIADWPSSKPTGYQPPPQWSRYLPFHDTATVAQAMEACIPETARSELLDCALAASGGYIFSFGALKRAYGSPVDWHLQPESGLRWRDDINWRRSLANAAHIGDVKLTWEPARFPHAYHMARAAAFFPAHRNTLASVLAMQMQDFVARNPFGCGVHWFSGQEIAVRLLAWLFATRTLLAHTQERDAIERLVGESLHACAVHIHRHLNYARVVVYNNHLIAEVLVLLAASILLPNSPEAARWQKNAMTVLTIASHKQIYPDGSYINQSHTYERVALQYFIWAILLLKAAGRAAPQSWLDAMDRALTFLVAHQCPRTGQLPNFGANDGAHPSIWTTCDYTDFRPLLQLVSVLVRGERLYEKGPWDEATAWCVGPLALDAPLRKPAYRSHSFVHTGHHVLRGTDPNTFATFRCGTVRERLTQADLLHLDVWIDGHNVLVDGGTYLYNGAAKWHEHFVGSASHNTVTVDGHSQMVHYRRFKHIYLAKARRLEFSDAPTYATVAGEHFGFVKRLGCTHRRSVLFIKDHTWVVVDTVTGEGRHTARLHWLAAPSPFQYNEQRGRLSLSTPAGAVHVTVYNQDAEPRCGTVVQGEENPPRGWYSRNYSVKVPAPSLAVEADGELPLMFITVISRHSCVLTRRGHVFVLDDEHKTSFSCNDGLVHAIEGPAT